MALSPRLRRSLAADSVVRSRRVTVGLGVFAVLSVGDVATYFLTDGSHPPREVATALIALGLVSLGLVVRVWLGAGRGALWSLVVLRALSALAAVPAFFVSDVPLPALLAAGAWVVLNVAGIVLIRPALTAAS